MTYREALLYLDTLANYEKTGILKKRQYNLDRMKRFASTFGNPHLGYKTIHVAGTKGKGSTASFIASMLEAAGFRVGLYTSPHLISIRERIRINGRPINEKEFAKEAQTIRDAASRFTRRNTPTYFEALTLMAFNFFKKKNIDFGVFEVGLGGRLDATNIIRPLAIGITPISFDHMEYLGHKLDSIAAEKAGVIKRGVPCVSSPQKKEALNAIKKRCSGVGAALYVVGRDIKVKTRCFDSAKEIFDIKGLSGEYKNCKARLVGHHQILNCANAVAVIEVLKERGFSIPKKAVLKGIERTSWPGRLEVARRTPYVILDGAQNAESARTLKDAIKRNFRFKDLYCVLGFSRDKDIKGMASQLAGLAKAFILTQAKNIRAASPQGIERKIGKTRTNIIKIPDAVSAYKKAIGFADKDDAVLVTGSLYLVGEIKRFLLKGHMI